MTRERGMILTGALMLTLFSTVSATGDWPVSKEQQANKIKVLIVDGQNNHDHWPKITYMMRQYLVETGKFDVEVDRTFYTWKGDELIRQFPVKGAGKTRALEEPKPDPDFKPKFSNYDVVICNFGWNAAAWPKETQRGLESFVRSGGGLVIVHAANNSFPQWKAYNEMIGLGGWGDRSEKHGPYVYYDDAGELVRDMTAGAGGSHGPQHEFTVTIRNADHPITKGMPLQWLHSKDELYDRLRGPAQNMEVLATAYSSADYKGTGRHEPMLLTLTYGDGRIFHTPMGHKDYSVECVGFITCLLRGVEWAATGQVTTDIPHDFPTEDEVSVRSFVPE